MLSLGLGYTLEPGLDIKTGAQRAQGTITGGGAPCYFATHGPSGSPLGSHGTRGDIPLSIGIPTIYICTWPWVHLKGIPDPGPGVGVYIWAAYFSRAPLEAIVDGPTRSNYLT